MQAPAAPITTEQVLTNFNLLSAATTNATLVSTAPSAGPVGSPRVRRLYNATITNNTAVAKFVKFYDKATAPTPGGDLGNLKFTIPLAANQTFVAFWGELGREFLLGLGFTITLLAAENDATVVAAGDVRVDLNFF